MKVFVTGASGWIGSAVVPELIGAGHRVVALARSDESAATLADAGTDVFRGDLDDLDALQRGATESDGVIHLAFKHDIAFSGDYQGAAEADRTAIETLGSALVGTHRPLVIASGILGVAPGRLATENDGREEATGTSAFGSGPANRHANAIFTLSLAARDVRSSVVRLPPTVHGDGDQGFIAMLVGVAREKGVSGTIGEGTSRWPAVHQRDAARLFRLALESASPGSVVHAVADEGVPIHDIADVIARHLEIPRVAIANDDAVSHFGWLANVLSLDSPASSEQTRATLAWQIAQVGLLADLDVGHYFR